MSNLMDYPILIIPLSLVTFWFAACAGRWLGGSSRKILSDERVRTDFVFVLGGTLTLLGLFVGFTFSMAVSRYDERKHYEEEEANAIGTEYVRADLLPTPDAATARSLLSKYLDQRILWYQTGIDQQRRRIEARTAELQSEMWSAVVTSTIGHQTAVTALMVEGMNAVLNSQGYTQAAWRNRIPAGAWILLAAVSIFCNVLIGYEAQGRSQLLLLILPIALSISLFLIADIESPRHGVIRVRPQNLESLAQSWHCQ